jgi:hypothetical protein
MYVLIHLMKAHQIDESRIKGDLMKKLIAVILVFAALLTVANPAIAANQRSMSAPIIAESSFLLVGNPSLNLSAVTATQTLPFGELSDTELSQVQGEVAPLILGAVILVGTGLVLLACWIWCK